MDEGVDGNLSESYSRTMDLGDGVRVFGSTRPEADWTWGLGHVEGLVAGWYPRPGRMPACLVKLVEAVPLSEREAHIGPPTGQYLVLRLRYKDAEWESEGVVHVEIFAVEPEEMDWDNGDHWVDGRASYELLPTTE